MLFCGIELEHPVINASGTFDALAAQRAFGDAVLEQFPFAAFVTKTVTLEPRAGNPPPRLWENAAGLINSIGLPNKGLAGFTESDLPQLTRLPVPLIVNVMGSTADEFKRLVSHFTTFEKISALELNVSCPNVKTGLDIGADPGELESLVTKVRRLTTKPLIVKLTPNVASVADTARGAAAGGADAISLINTLRGMPLHPKTGKKWLGGGTGGVSGPAVRAVALAQINQVAEAVEIPIVGMGGIQNSAHASDFFAAGATLVAVGTETFRSPQTASRIAQDLT